MTTNTCSDEYTASFKGVETYVTIINKYTEIKTKYDNYETIIMTYDSFIVEL